MTLRARPVARRRGRAGWDAGDRRNSLINIGFFVAIGLSVLILLGYAAWSWYDGHFGAAATVNGQVITKDALINRIKIEDFNLGYVERRIQTLLALGRVSNDDAQRQLDIISQRRQQLASLTLERLVDVSLQASLAADNGVTVSDGDVDAQMLDLATTSEERHVWVIEVQPDADAITGEVSTLQRNEALLRAQKALAQLQSGVSWEDVARTVSDSGIAPQSGDLGWLAKESGYDVAFMDAVFAVGLNAPTGIVEGEDGVFRIGRVTESAGAEVDQTFQQQIQDAGISLADYRVAARGDVVRKKLSDKIVADLSAPSKQRHVLEIYLPEPNAATNPAEEGVKVRHIVFAPNDDTTNAKDLPDTDPAWAKAKAEADAAYAELKLHPEKFDSMARTLSDERTAKVTGGKQPWYYVGSTVDAAFKTAILADGPHAGPAPAARQEHLRLARDPVHAPGGRRRQGLARIAQAEGDQRGRVPPARDRQQRGQGSEGWRRHRLGRPQRARGRAGQGALRREHRHDVGRRRGRQRRHYLFWVLGEETRDATKDQLKIFKDSGFSDWYTKQKDAAKIDYNIGSSTSGA